MRGSGRGGGRGAGTAQARRLSARPERRTTGRKQWNGVMIRVRNRTSAKMPHAKPSVTRMKRARRSD